VSDITSKNHRSDFATCPHCDSEVDYEGWDKAATKANFRLDRFAKHGSAIVISECPRCSGLSWVHVPLDSFKWEENYPRRWKARAVKAIANRQLRALRQWGAGICWKCKNLESGSVTTAARRECIVGCGGPVSSCESFVELTQV